MVYGRYLRYMKVYEGIWKYMEVYKVYPDTLKISSSFPSFLPEDFFNISGYTLYTSIYFHIPLYKLIYVHIL